MRPTAKNQAAKSRTREHMHTHAVIDPDHYMGIRSALSAPPRRNTFLFDQQPLSYLLTTRDGSSHVLTMIGPHALLDGVRCDESTCHRSNKILARFGTREVALQLYPDQLGGSGVIRSRDNRSGSEIVTSTAAIATPSLRASVDVQALDGTWRSDWAMLTITVDKNGQPSASIALATRPDESIPVATIGSSSEPLSFMIFLGSAVSTNDGYLEGKLSMSDSGLLGTMYLQVPNPAYNPNIRGSCRYNHVPVAARARWCATSTLDHATSALQREIAQSSRDSLQPQPPPVDIDHPSALWRLLSSSTDLSVGELIGMTPPDNADLADAVCKGIINCALRAAPKSWLDDLSLTRPDPIPELASIADDPANQAFFQKYATAMGCSELGVPQMQSGWTNVTGGWETVKARMGYFWGSGTEGCLGADKDFLRINEDIAQVYFSTRMRSFQRYLALPQTDRTAWAQQLLDGVTTRDMMMRMLSTKESESIHKYIIMLRALDRNGGFDKEFTKRVNQEILNQSVMRLGAADFESVEEFLTKTLLMLADPACTMAGSMMDGLRADIEDLKTNDPDGWIKFSGSLAEIGTQLAELAISLRNTSWQKRVDEWRISVTEQFPSDPRRARLYSQVGTIALAALNAAFAVFELIGDIETWSKLRPDQKVAAISNAVEQIAVIAEGTYGFIKFIREPTAPISVEMDLFRWKGDLSVLPEEAIGSDAWEQALARNVASATKYDLAVFLEPMNALAVVVTVISMVSLGFQVAKDIESDEPTVLVVFEIIEEVAMAASLLALPLMAANPIAGAVIVVVGIIIGIVVSFIPRNPPPIIRWALDVGTPFVNTIPNPPAKSLARLAAGITIFRRRALEARPTLAKAIGLGVSEPMKHTLSIGNLLSFSSTDDKELAANTIWMAIQAVRNISDSDLVALFAKQVSTSKSVGPVFFLQSGTGNMINAVDYGEDFRKIGIGVMGRAISTSTYFNNVDGNGCKTLVEPSFQNQKLSVDLFLDGLYRKAGFEAFALYSRKETVAELLSMILAPGFIPLEFWKNAQNLFPTQVLLLLASNWGADLSEVRTRLKTWCVTDAVFDMADGRYNFFQNFASQPQSAFWSYIDSNQDIQAGLASTRPAIAGAALANSLTRYAWGNVNYTRAYPVPGMPEVIPAHYDQDINNIYGEAVAAWVNATSELPVASRTCNNAQLNKTIRLDNHAPGGFPKGSDADLNTDDFTHSCFPGCALVTLPSGRQVPISSLRHGDRILTLDSRLHPRYSEVFFFGHRDASAKARFKALLLEDGRTLQLTGGHFLTISDSLSWKRRRFSRAGSVRVGQFAWISPDTSGEATARPSRIVSIEDQECEGLYNPYTLDSSMIVVDGILASTHSEWFLDGITPEALARFLPYVYDACMWPARLAYRAMGAAWAESLQDRIDIDGASREGSGLTALIRPYALLAYELFPTLARGLRNRLIPASRQIAHRVEAITEPRSTR